MKGASGTFLAATRLVAAGPPAEAPSSFLPAPEAVRLLADGKPWTAMRSDGERVTLTLAADGSGRFVGPFSRDITWRLQGEALCIRIGFPLGGKCLRFRRVAAGLQAFDGEAPDLLLSR